jgi:hypothetical protein
MKKFIVFYEKFGFKNNHDQSIDESEAMDSVADLRSIPKETLPPTEQIPMNSETITTQKDAVVSICSSYLVTFNL